MRLLTVVVSLTVSTLAGAQSAQLLEAVRLHKPSARALAAEELAACEQASCAKVRELSLLNGYLLLSVGESHLASEQLQKHPSPKGLEAFHAFYLGQARFYSRDMSGAAQAFGAAMKSAPPSLLSRVRARCGEALLAAGQHVEAAPLLEQAAMEANTPELLFQRARARELTGNLDGAKADRRAVALRFPAHPYADEALGKVLSSRALVPFTLDERIQRAGGFLDAQLPQRALDEMDEAEKKKLERGASAQARVALVRARALFALAREDEANAQVDKALKGAPLVASEALMLRARKVMRSNDNERARALMAEVDKKFQKQPAADDAAYFVGWLDIQGGRYADAVKAFERFDKRYPSSRKRDEAMWFKALACIRMSDWAKASAAMDALAQAFPKSSLVTQARYWRTRTSQLGGAPKDELIGAYHSIVEDSPATFYALLSRVRLKELGVMPQLGFPSPPTVPKEVPTPEALKLARLLADSGLFRDALEEVNLQAGLLRGNGEESLQFAQALQRLSEFGPAYGIGARLFWGAAFSQKDPNALALLYPRAYASAVEEAAKTHGVDPFYIWAIMRRESAFRPEVVSSADARGLMQLIPPTAAGIGAAIKNPLPSPDMLYAPSVNVYYATWYLNALWKRFNHPTLVAAAYNAGPAPAVKWAADRGDLELDLFVETIPYKETRGYVKQVVADYFLYHAFYGDPQKQPTLLMKVPQPLKEGVNF